MLQLISMNLFHLLTKLRHFWLVRFKAWKIFILWHLILISFNFRCVATITYLTIYLFAWLPIIFNKLFSIWNSIIWVRIFICLVFRPKVLRLLSVISFILFFLVSQARIILIFVHSFDLRRSKLLIFIIDFAVLHLQHP